MKKQTQKLFFTHWIQPFLYTDSSTLCTVLKKNSGLTWSYNKSYLIKLGQEMRYVNLKIFCSKYIDTSIILQGVSVALNSKVLIAYSLACSLHCTNYLLYLNFQNLYVSFREIVLNWTYTFISRICSFLLTL